MSGRPDDVKRMYVRGEGRGGVEGCVCDGVGGGTLGLRDLTFATDHYCRLVATLEFYVRSRRVSGGSHAMFYLVVTGVLGTFFLSNVFVVTFSVVFVRVVPVRI